MYIKFDGVRGTGGCCGVLADGDSVLLMGVEGRGEPRCSEASLFAASSFVTASGGGKGDIETLEMDAECAW